MYDVIYKFDNGSEIVIRTNQSYVDSMFLNGKNDYNGTPVRSIVVRRVKND